ncbi:hypothetical protein BGX28_007811 [Mortierella sp. GBA30]|nr:hypothetical protein BGX28_007811 [Mortierella sp. GBA30]
MSLFKSSKNQSASAAASPASTPRSSVHEQRPAQVNKMTQEQALEKLLLKSMPNAAAGAYSSKRASKINNNTSSASAVSTPAGSRRTSMHDSASRPAKTEQQIRDELMQIVMSKCILVHPSQPFVL